MNTGTGTGTYVPVSTGTVLKALWILDYFLGSESHFPWSFESGSNLTCKKFRIQLQIRPYMLTVTAYDGGTGTVPN
jgi:hypothetical protein